jgi:subtilisin family serine protease
MARPSRWLASTLAAGLTAALAIATPATAAPPSPSAPAIAPTAVTLLTGDVVGLVEAAPGRYAATVHPGPGRESITFHTLEIDGGLLVLPSDVVPYLSAGLLDERLFDVPGLVAQGYDDASAPRLPLIVRYRDPGVADLVPGGQRLNSIDGAAIAPSRAELGRLWREVADPTAVTRTPQLLAGVAGIWLDGRVAPVLDRSTGQVGATDAWDAGFTGTGVDIAVLDTGIADTHPDLAGKVTAVANFSDSPTAEDRFGHGTHVAAIAAGTGSASGGANRGVAPGANLLSGKVLNDFGSGLESWIISGMEWAVGQGAEVVNMSLGGSPTDGTDPLSVAVNRLSGRSRTLFVISAGNNSADYAVGSPGAASAALTVGAVDRDDSLADFSSRGPRVGDNALKPEITAPGVGIVAARAAGTELGTPLDGDYTAASGTSMAAPHVAGAAALLAQAHPGWDGAVLKDALVSTADPNPELAVYAQGGGRLDAARAVIQEVHATGVVDFGLHARLKPGGQGRQTAAGQLVYTNAGDSAVTLDLTVDLANVDRVADASGAVTLEETRITVPAGERVTVPVKLHLGQLQPGRLSGRITATGSDGVLVRTAVSATLTAPKHRVTFRGVAADGNPVGADLLALHGDEPRTDLLWFLPDGRPRTLEIEAGTYLLHALISDFDPQFEQSTLITNPELRVTGDMEVVLDARTATPVRIETPEPSEQRTVFSYYVHRELENGRGISHGVMHFSTVQQLNVTPTEPVSSGEYEFSSRWQLVAPMVEVSVPGVPGPLDVNLLHQSPVFEDERELRLVYAGTGAPEELAAAGVRDAVALMTGVEDRMEQEQIAAAAEAGAAVALIVRARDFAAWTVWTPAGFFQEPIPALVVRHVDGLRLIDHAREHPGEARIILDLEVSSPYLYDVMHVETGRVPDQVVHRVTTDNSARFTVGYTDTGGFEWLKEQRFCWRPWQGYAWNDTQRFTRAGTARDEWVSAGDTLCSHVVQHEYTFDDLNPLRVGMTEPPRSFSAGPQDPVTWFGPVIRPAAPAGVPGLVSTRIRNLLALRVPEFVDSGPGHFLLADESEVRARLLRDGTVVATLPDARRGVLVGPDPAWYQLELATERNTGEWRWGTRTETAWTFHSQRPASDQPQPLPLLQVDYRVPADLTGQVPGQVPHALTLNVRQQDGLPAPEVRVLELEVSFDEGSTWQAVPASRDGNTLLATVPSGEGSVSLRVHAEAVDGSAVTQTVIRAYGLR